MAIAPTGAIYKALIFDGESSRNYGVYITGEAVYNAPQRDVEMISIPGRNGAYALDKGRFQNIEVSYPAGIFADTETNFADAISDFRNFLCSRNGYVRLTDEYNPNEYRMAVYKSGLEVSPAQLKAGQFEIKFECKPQRWLTSGETKTTMGAWGDTTTVTDSIVEIDNSDGILSVKDDTVAIEAVQSGSGTPSPSNVRAISGWTDAHVYVGAVSGTPDTTYTIDLSSAGTVYGGTLDVTTGVLTVTHALATFDGSSDESWQYFSVAQGNLFRFTQSDRKAGEIYSLGAYCNRFEVVRNADRTNGTMSSPTSGSEYALDFIYDGCTDLASWKTWLSSNNVQVVYELATATTYTLTAQEIELLTGPNYVWADCGDSTIEYGQDPSIIVNPTLFDASPMLEVEGYGTINCNGHEVEIENKPLGNITLWEENGYYVTKSTQASLSFETEKVVNGDALTLGSSTQNYGIEIGAYFNIDPEYTFSLFGNTVTSYSGTISSDEPSKGYVSSPSRRLFVFVKNPNTLYFNVGTSGSYTYTATITGNIQNISTSATSAYTVTVNFTIAYDGDATITYSTSRTIDNDPAGKIIINDTTQNNLAYRFSVLSAYSNVSALGTPTYIDCDLGVVYMIENGTVIDLNSYVDLGSDMPVLSPGSNTITYDNTITDLKVVPRWWKV